MVVLATLYKKILGLDKRIRFAAVVNERGHIVRGGMRENIEPVEPLEKTPSLIAQLVAQESAEARSEFFGKPEYSLLVHEKISALIFYVRKGVVLVTAERDFPMRKIPLLRRMVQGRRAVRR